MTTGDRGGIEMTTPRREREDDGNNGNDGTTERRDRLNGEKRETNGEQPRSTGKKETDGGSERLKRMSENNTNNNGIGGSSSSNHHHHNWLGFSLSPHMKMELPSTPHNHYHNQNQNTASAASVSVSNADVPITSFYLSSSDLHNNNNNGGLCNYSENGGFHHSPLSVMPLKSDGSLCIMEALTRSHQSEGMVVHNSSPKLEDFLGGATMETHHHNHYATHQETETMGLSLDSFNYYTTNASQHNNNVGQQHFSHSYYTGIPCQAGFFNNTPLDDGTNKDNNNNNTINCDSQISQMGNDDGLKNWISRHYPTQNDHDGSSVNGSTTMGCGDLQTLTLSMSPGSQSSCVTAPRQISPTGAMEQGVVVAMESKKRGAGKVGQKQPVHRKSIDTFGQRTSQYRGVTRHRWTGRYEAHLWDNSCKKEGQTRKGRQGGYDMEDKAARAYDLAALKYWGPSTHINFPLENYCEELEGMKNMSRQEYVAHLRRKSSGFSRGASMYRGVTRHHQHGRWQARIGRVAGNKDLYLGTFSTQEEAAEAYDVAAIKFRGVNAVTNFDITRYDVERIIASNTLLAGEMARRNKDVTEPTNNAIEYNTSTQQPNNVATEHDWKMTLYQNAQQQTVESLNQNSMDNANYRNPVSFSLQDLPGIDSVTMVDDSAKLGAHFSNPSSLVTSLSSSREASPDKNGTALLFAKPPLASKYIGPTGVTSWFPTGQLRPTAISMSHLPVFAAWTDN
ncbi:hypothetical protein ACFE04_005933 [Oxalis oulophora]